MLEERDLFCSQNTTNYLETSPGCGCIIGKKKPFETLRYNF
jgi:hypothetical protein